MIRSRFALLAMAVACCAVGVVALAASAPAAVATVAFVAAAFLALPSAGTWFVEHVVKGSHLDRLSGARVVSDLFPAPQTGTPQATSYG